jgi:hypothetical protein
VLITFIFIGVLSVGQDWRSECLLERNFLAVMFRDYGGEDNFSVLRFSRAVKALSSALVTIVDD